MTNTLQSASKLFFGSLIASMTLLIGFSSAFSGTGSGTSGDPFQITTCAEFMEINDALSADYVLLNDIDCSEDGNDIMIGGATPQTSFVGTFNGSGHSITIDINSSENHAVGLFRRVHYEGVIENTHVIGSIVGRKNTIGGLVAVLNGGTVSGSSATVTITLTSPIAPDNYYLSVGGLVGMMAYGTTINSSVDVIITTVGGEGVGAIVGTAYEQSTLSGCYATGTVSGNNGIGGLVGFTEDGLTISNCYSMVSVSGSGWGIGGLVGYADSATTTIENSFAAGLVNGESSVGGLVGTGTSLMNAGGSFRDILDEANPLTDAANGSLGLNTTTLQNIQTYLDAGWDISPWGTDMNNGYPFLAREVQGSNSAWYIYTDDVLGCMDEDADNYDENATRDDGSCTYTILGCMDEDADNYDEEATVDDDSCTYTEEEVVVSSGGGSGGGGGGSYSNVSMTFAQKVVANLQGKWTALSHTQKQNNVKTIITLYGQIQDKVTINPELKAKFEEIIGELLKQYPIGN